MAGDLERFLQQAAERLRERAAQAQGASPNRPRQLPRQPVRQAERARQFEDEVVEAEIVDAQVLNPRELGPDPLSNIDTRPGLAQVISLADEKMADHVHDVFDHEVMHLSGASEALKKESDKNSQVTRREMQSSPLVDMLRNPETLRAAFLASEIFQRKF